MYDYSIYSLACIETLHLLMYLHQLIQILHVINLIRPIRPLTPLREIIADPLTVLFQKQTPIRHTRGAVDVFEEKVGRPLVHGGFPDGFALVRVFLLC